VRDGVAWQGKGEAAVAFTPERFSSEASRVKLPVLLAERVPEAAIEAARGKAPGDYLVCSIAILD
jgi:hypothetical protein